MTISFFSGTNLPGTRKYAAFLIAFFSILQVTPVKSQTTIVTDSSFISNTTVVIPAKQYSRSGFHNLFWGKHYRKEWATAIRVPNFYLDSVKGGLTPTEESGSRQTKGLRLKDKNGKEYVLRSVDKDFGKALPDIFQGTFATRIAKDQASIGHPYAAITIYPMISVTGIYHTTPVIVFVPDQPALGPYNGVYSNQLYLFEERPDDNQEDAPNFGKSKNVIGSEKLFEHVYGDNDHQVDQTAFVKARLFDMVIGDWSRHADQWRWAQFEEKNKKIYRPIPRDRDQAYSKFDGLWPWFATHIAGAIHLESFKPKIHRLKNFNLPARSLDRRFTNQLTEEEWITAARDIQSALTDSVIESAVHQMPPQLFSISGPGIIENLKSRRDHLQEYSSGYCRYLARHPEIIGTYGKEFFKIERLNKKHIRISVYKITRENQIKPEPFYSRTFGKKETNEIRIYSLKKNDVFSITGERHGGIKLKIIDPDGTDSFTTKPRGKTHLWRGKQFEFDSTRKDGLDFKFLPLFSPHEYRVFENDPLPLFTTTGVRVSINLFYYPETWRKKEYVHQHLLSANYGFLRSAFNAGYVGRLGNYFGKWDLVLKARADLPAVENFYGAGNETKILSTETNYNRVLSTRFYGGVALERVLDSIHFFGGGIFYQYVKPKELSSHFPGGNGLFDPSLVEARHFGGIGGSYHFRKTNNHVFPTGGIDLYVAAGYMRNLEDRDQSFFNINSSFAFYIPLGKSFSLASRAGIAALGGQADFYHLNKLSGNENLRGYERERFSGKTIAFNNNELRWVTNTRNYFFNGKIGLLAFFDEGRVWQPLEVSGKWHTGYGAGLILIPFNIMTLTGTYCISEEGKQILLKAGLFF